MLISIIWIFFLLPISIWYFDPKIQTSFFYIIGVLSLISLSIYNYKTKKHLPIKLSNYSGNFGIFILLFSNPGLNNNNKIYLLIIFILSQFIVIDRLKSAIKYFLIFVIIALLYQAFTLGFYYYPNSNKTVLLVWNPNVFWHHITILLILYIFIQRKIPIIPLIVVVVLNQLLGSSRGALILLALFVALFICRRTQHIYKIITTSFISAFIILSVFIFLFPNYSYKTLIKYDDISNGRFTSISDKFNPYISSTQISDIPLLDIILSNNVYLFVIGLIIIIYNYRSDYLTPILFLFHLSIDSTIYAPIISFCYYQIFRINELHKFPENNHKIITPKIFSLY